MVVLIRFCLNSDSGADHNGLLIRVVEFVPFELKLKVRALVNFFWVLHAFWCWVPLP